MSFSCRLCSASRVAAVALARHRQRALPERAAHDRRVLDQHALERARASRAARRAGPAPCRAARTARRLPRWPGGGPSPRRRTGCRRRARRPPRRRRCRPLSLPTSDTTSSRVCSTVSGSSRMDVASWRPPPHRWRRSISSSRARHSRISGPRTHCAQVLDQVEHAVVGPVDVLEHEHQRVAPRHRLDHRAHRREEDLAHALRVLALGLRDVERRLDAEQPPDHGGAALGRLGHLAGDLHQRVDRGEQLVPRLLGAVAVEDPGLGADHLGQRPVDDSRAVRQAAALAEGGCRVALAQQPLQLLAQARLADAGLPDHRHEVRAALALDPVIDGPQQLQLVRAPDQRRLAEARRGARRAGAPADPWPPTPGPARPCPSA